MPANSGSVRAGGAFVEIFADNTPLVRGLKRAQTLVSGFAKGLRSTGTKIAAPLALAGVTGLAGLMAMSDGFVAMGATQRDTAGQAAVLGVALARLRAATRVLSLSIFSLFAPALSTLFTWLARVAVGAAKWIRDNRGMIMTALAVAAAIAGVGLAIFGLGTVLSMIATAIGGFLTLWGAIGAVLAFVISPLGLVLTALTAISAWFFTSTEAGRGAIAWFADAFGTLATDATTAWGGIVAAVQAGDLQAAFNIAIAFLRLQWVRATNFLEARWIEFKNGFLSLWEQAQVGIAIAWTNTVATLETTFVQARDFLLDAWTHFATKFRNIWSSAQNYFAKGFGWIIAKLEGLDPNEVMAELDADLSRRTSANNESANTAIADRERVRKERVAAIEQNRQDTTATIGDDLGRRREERERRQAKAAEEAEAALVEAQKGFADSVKSVSKTPAVQDFGPGVERAAQAASASDIRSAEGLKSVMFALTGQSNPQQMALKYTQQIAANSTKQLEETEKTRKAVEDNAVEQERI